MNANRFIHAKPRIRWNGFVWHCSGSGVSDFGTTPSNAYTMWQKALTPRNAVAA